MTKKVQVFYKGAEITVFDAVVEKSSELMTDVATIEVPKTQTVVLNDEVYININGVKKFGGYVSGFNKEYAKTTVNIKGYGKALEDKVIQHTKYPNDTIVTASPEAIVEDLVETYTDLTYASTGASGVTLSKYIATGNLLEAVQNLAKMLNWQIRVDANKNFYFQEDIVASSSLTLNVGVDPSHPEYYTSRANRFQKDESKVINDVYITGGNVTYSTQETFSGDGVEDEFTLSKNPEENIRITVGGTEQVPDTDYTVDVEAKLITFISIPASGTNNIVVTYSYNDPVYARYQDKASQSTYGIKSTSISADWIYSYADARQYAEGIIATYKDALWYGELRIAGLKDALDDNTMVHVHYTAKSIDQDMLIKRIKWSYRDGITEVEVGSYIPLVFDWQREVVSRIRDLEKRYTVVRELERLYSQAEDINITDSHYETTGIVGMFLLDDTLEGYGDFA